MPVRLPACASTRTVASLPESAASICSKTLAITLSRQHPSRVSREINSLAAGLFAQHLADALGQCIIRIVQRLTLFEGIEVELDARARGRAFRGKRRALRFGRRSWCLLGERRPRDLRTRRLERWRCMNAAAPARSQRCAARKRTCRLG